MDKMDTYLMGFIGVLVIAMIAVEMIPLPAPVQYVPLSRPVTHPAVYRAPALNGGSVATLTVFGTSSLATLNIVGG
jgi:hypothetical protein